MRKILISLLFLLGLSLSTQAPIVAVQFGDNTPSGVQSAIMKLLTTSSQYPIQQYLATDDPFPSLEAGSFLLSFGKTVTSGQVLNYDKLADAGSEALIVYNDVSQDIIRLVSDGNPRSSTDAHSVGAGYAAYRALELLGFAFLHPLEPTIPPQLQKPSQKVIGTTEVDAPRWPVRGTHYHTEHPLELTEVLQGMGTNASMDASDPSWASMLPEVELFAQWLVATRQNSVEWILLCADSWKEFCPSDLRAQRLETLTGIFHSFGVQAGADLPIAEKQQFAWYMIQTFDTLEHELAQIKDRIDWLIARGFDYIATESGFSEFTHPDDDKMLGWMEYTADYAASLGYQVYIKCHCSTGQTCKTFKDPRDNKPLNFNFLPMMANKTLGIFAHTVQLYSLDDPAPTYGNTNFSYMFDFMMYEASKRPTIYHGETAYWVNYDIDVPLFLPLYPDSRLRDLRKVAQAETATNRIQGQINFCSGFEWGYWLSDAMTAYLGWNPTHEVDEATARRQILSRTLAVFGDATEQIVELIEDIIAAEYQLLVLGQVTGKPAPADVTKLNGMAYLAGWDTWSSIGSMRPTSATQPNKFSLLKMRWDLTNSGYKQVAPLLQEMADTFTTLAQRFDQIRPTVPEYTLPLFNDLADSMQMTALRAVQVNALYAHVAHWTAIFGSSKKKYLEVATKALEDATAIVREREQHYRVPVERIAGWRKNPTVYVFTYLWTVHSLYYMWRDHDLATWAHTEALSPCYMNIINPVDTAFGEGVAANMTQTLYDFASSFNFTDPIVHCLAAPREEPHYPLGK